ncbi:MAG: cyclic beta 1-2 glucan synthetase [Phycisphaerales bacterium]|nr:cyclic beta 1-2 glucan synthetase [Phycisphaerales bacterium]
MLRLALIENLRRVATRISAGRRDRDLAHDWAEKMLAVVEKNPADLVLVLADLARARIELTCAFTAEFVRRIQGRHSSLSFVMEWLGQRLSEQGTTIEQAVAAESQHQASDQVSVGNSITSLRFLDSMDWREFVETLSLVEHTLRSDPADVYNDMDFATRDHYRHVVERIAKHCPLSEQDVAAKVIELARAGMAAQGPRARCAHVGYFLIDDGLGQLHKACRRRRTPLFLMQRGLQCAPFASYISAILLFTAVIVLLGVWGARSAGMGWGWIIALGILPIWAGLHLAITLVNFIASLTVPPRILPRMNFASGIPSDHRTLVIVPTMLSSKAAIDEMIELLEIRYLANRDPSLYFGLLTDYTDAPQAQMPNDEALLAQAQNGIEQLRRKYADDRSEIFYLFHRPRLWNQAEGVWMGYERKRGKLFQLNSVLRGDGVDQFQKIVGDVTVLRSVEYVITLDTDTQLPRDAARQMVGVMAHPLNHPVFDPVTNTVVKGYSILQPRVGVSLSSANKSLYVRLWAGDPGIDPYTRTVSDVYQDLFGEGSFIGKGIYDVNAFERALKGRFAENAILSHDLLEGAHARSGLISDVILIEDHPSRVTADIGRRHRWARGDWQILYWLLPRVPGGDGRWVKNVTSALSRWKFFDNLRRSLVPPALVLLLIVGWLAGGWISGGITLGVLVVLGLTALVGTVMDLLRSPPEVPWWMHARSALRGGARSGLQFLYQLTFLAYDACIYLDAIGRTLHRLFISRRHLLEWRTASDAERSARTDLAGHWLSMWPATMLAVAVGILIMLVDARQILVAGPLLVLWLVSPAVAWWLSKPLHRRQVQLLSHERVFLNKLARRTWRYFQTFVNQDNNWLAPDNFQEHPVAVVAQRTSPTNMGLSLLANVSAWDFGFISGQCLLDRTEKQLNTLDRLDLYRGHFYNWYDTRTLRPLPPLYVSTVDSGNMAGHLMVLREALYELPDQSLVSPQMFAGLRTTAQVLLEIARGEFNYDNDRKPVAAPLEVIRKIDQLETELGNAPSTLAASALFLQRIARNVNDIAAAAAGHKEPELHWWTQALVRDVRDHADDLNHLASWSMQSAPPEALWQRGSSQQVNRLADLRQHLRELDKIPTLRQLSQLQQTLLPQLEQILADLPDGDGERTTDRQWLGELRDHLDRCSRVASRRIEQTESLALRVRKLEDMDFAFLYDRSRELLTIGFNVSDHRIDQGYYDLLASEARLTSFVGIAQGQLPQEHWFALGRMLTNTGGQATLLSWSGSMFEYLMPNLVMPTYEDTLLDQTNRSVVRRQIDYGRRRSVPWGISESGYNTTDVDLNYQYRAFGVPGLGLKRGLGDDLVIAPYASVMALMVLPRQALANLQRLTVQGCMGPYGFFEAVDYTPSRVPRGKESVTLRSFMAHHEGMSLLALAYLLLDQPMQRRFGADPSLAATDLLLQERVPKAAPFYPHAAEVGSGRRSAVSSAAGTMRVFTNPASAVPEVHLLSNGRYNVCVSSAGGGYSRWKDLAVTRWREDPTRDHHGTFIYLRDAETGDYWSTAHQPTLRRSRHYEAVFTQARAEFRRRDLGIDTHTEISVSPEDDIELRRVTISNRSGVPRTIEVTTYAEAVLTPAAAEMSHPAFANLFIQTHIDRAHHAIVCTRRPRSAGEQTPWMLHLMTAQGKSIGETSYETDRAAFIGRGRSTADPQAVVNGGELGNSEGAVLDPIVAIRRTIYLAPDESARIDVITGVAETREQAASLAEKYHDPRLADRVFEMAWTHSQVVLRHLNATEADAQIYGRLAGSMIYANALRRADASTLIKNRNGQPGLWGYGISGDLPIVLLRIADQEKIDLVRQVIQAHSYWRMKGLTTDLVIWNDDSSVYRQALYDQIMGLIASSSDANLIDKPGGIFVRRGEQLSGEDRILLQTVARVVIADSGGTLAEQVERRGRTEPVLAAFQPVKGLEELVPVAAEVPQRELQFANGYGGFTPDGREYVTTLHAQQNTPAPWSNVIANPDFGTLVSESGAGYTWFENCHEYRLTTWHNDPVTDASGEAFYIRDEESGRFWSPSPLPVRGEMPYTTRHGFGYSVYEYTDDGISSEMTVFVSVDAPVRFTLIKLRNNSGRTRRLSVSSYVEWVLGDQRHKTLMHVVSEFDSRSGTFLARNPFNTEFANHVAFLDCSVPGRRVTGDRSEFIGRNGSLSDPAAMGRERLSGKVGAGLDPCGAMQTYVELAEGQETEIVFVLGAADGEGNARNLAQRYRTVGTAREELGRVHEHWNHMIGTMQVKTPEPSLDMLANGWLVYQVLSCRVWGRTGYYQSGGAYGFRDQLQDTMALLHPAPWLSREHLLRAAARQFKEGDVQHWWHPPQGRGVRTHFSDDYLWLPYATCRYVLSLHDTGVLDEPVHYLEGRAIRADEESYYDMPSRSEERGTLYEHCVRAIENGLKFGRNGLPLMGCGDWNDGMNLVGQHGQGESVWLGFFLYDVLVNFAEVALLKDDQAFADRCHEQAKKIRANIEANAWDGQWYRRAYFDNGEPLGSAQNLECQIDSLPQSWGILTGAADPERARLAMQAVDTRLVRRDANLIQLFDPPFDKGYLNPGYIKGYVPGVRENGGQYTHAAIWTIMAFAAMGNHERAWELFHMINPVNHGANHDTINTYKVEPYVVAADVYAVQPHTGRGGWTWYTGSAGWMYRLITESLLGLKLHVDKLTIEPVVPVAWKEYQIHYRYRETQHHITVHCQQGATQTVKVVQDGQEMPDKMIQLIDDRQDHQIEVYLGSQASQG